MYVIIWPGQSVFGPFTDLQEAVAYRNANFPQGYFDGNKFVEVATVWAVEGIDRLKKPV